MHPRVSVSQICSMKWTLEQDLSFYAAEGIRNAGVFFPKIAKDTEARVASLRGAGLRISAVTALAGPIIAPPPGTPALLERLRPAIDAAAALGAGACYFTSGAAPSRMPADERYAALVPLLAPAVEYARARGTRMALEHNSLVTPDNGFVHTLADCAGLSRESGIAICLELQNCWTERHLPRLFRDNVDRIAVVQVSDFKVGETLRYNRRVPGDGDIPLEWLIGNLLEAGYEGFFELETLGRKIEEEGYPSSIRRSVDWLSDCLTRLGA